MPRDAVPPVASPAAPASSAADGPTVRLRSFTLVGDATVFSREELQAMLAPALGRTMSLAELRNALLPITTQYRERGYFLARAVLPPQDVTDGVVKVQILEGKLDPVDGVSLSSQPKRLSPKLAQALVARPLQAGAALRLADVERGVLLLNDLPGIAASANLEPGSAPDTTRLVLDVTEQRPWSAQLSADNHGSRYTQSARVGAQAAWYGLTGHGDLSSLELNASPNGDYRYARLGHSAVISATGLRLGLALSALDYRVGQELSALDATGNAQTVSATARLPIVRSRDANVSAHLAADHKRLRNEVLAARTSDKRVDLLSAELNADRLQGDAFTAGDVSLGVGRLDLGANAASLAQDQGPQGARTQGTFAKLNLSASHERRVAQRLTLAVQAQAQVASKNLDSSEQFLLGGADGVRAYPSGEAAGASGVRASVEARWLAFSHAAAGDLSLQAFADWGHIRRLQDASDLTQTTDNSYSIAGAGVGATLTQPGRWEVRAQWAHAIGSNPGRNPTTGFDSDGRSSKSRAWLSLRLSF